MKERLDILCYLRIDYVSLLLHKVTTRAFWSSSVFTLFTEHKDNYMCLSSLPALAWVKPNRTSSIWRDYTANVLTGNYIQHPTSVFAGTIMRLFACVQLSDSSLYICTTVLCIYTGCCSEVSALLDGMFHSPASHSHLSIPPKTPKNLLIPNSPSGHASNNKYDGIIFLPPRWKGEKAGEVKRRKETALHLLCVVSS